MGTQRGVGKLEVLGIVFAIAFLLAMIPLVRETAADVIGFFFDQRDAVTGERTTLSTALLGIAITIAAVLTFIGAGYLLLWTNLGAKLAFLVIGTVTMGWLTINGVLFIVFAPRGIRPEDLEGLNAIQMRVPAIAMTLGALVLFVMFMVALDRYEAEEPA
ncbi:MAG: hypothetical protein EHM57_01600 [Actinobacteria bacterium]|nr:MAG: hypothetical protein EHM57_01600 [Actinomycetota bacterium]